MTPIEVIELALKKSLEYLSSNQIEFTRGDPTKFFTKLTNFHYGLTIGTIENEFRVENVYHKNIYALWNILVDDEIDIYHQVSMLTDSVDTLLGNNSTPNKLVAELLKPFSTNKDILGLATSDLSLICTGFKYESEINNNFELATLKEYDKLSTLTASILYYLDLDFLYSRLDISWYTSLKDAYIKFGKAVKYASDIGSYSREVSKEHNLNSILIALIEQGVHRSELFDMKDFNNPKLKQIVSMIKDKSTTYYLEGMKIINEHSQIETRNFQKTIKAVIDSYAGGIDF